MSAMEEQWRQLLRRSYGIPNLVTDDHAMIAIAQQLAAENVTVLHDPPRVFRAIVDTLVTVGGESRLDDCLLPVKLGDKLRSTGVLSAGQTEESAVDRVMNVVRTSSAWPGDPGSLAVLQCENVVFHLLNQVGRYAHDHPVEDFRPPAK